MKADIGWEACLSTPLGNLTGSTSPPVFTLSPSPLHKGREKGFLEGASPPPLKESLKGLAPSKRFLILAPDPEGEEILARFSNITRVLFVG